MALENKLGITSSPELAEAEEKISKKKAIFLFSIQYPFLKLYISFLHFFINNKYYITPCAYVNLSFNTI